FHFGVGSAMSLAAMAVMLIFTAFYVRALRRQAMEEMEVAQSMAKRTAAGSGMRRRARWRKAAGTGLFDAAVALVLVTVLIPYLWMVSGSFKSSVELQAADVTRPGMEPSWIPRQFTL